jgi:sirohydrochlorin cobaltochelatase
MKTVIVLAMHGVPPRDFPRDELVEFFGLEARLGAEGAGHGAGPGSDTARRRHADLDGRIRSWPRTAGNDPFFDASTALAAELERATGHEVILGFNEFCAPDLDEALDRAAAARPDKVVVVTAMMTPGGEHAEADIPRAIARARERHPGLPMVYAWPFEVGATAGFLAQQMKRFLR